jgi:hypothetical protein
LRRDQIGLEFFHMLALLLLGHWGVIGYKCPFREYVSCTFMLAHRCLTA